MRALSDVEVGSYVDLGAYHPVKHSVSLAFYQKGWRGIHVEPVPQAAQEFRAARPDEEVIEAACSSGDGNIDFTIVGTTGLSTAIPENVKPMKGHDIRRINVRTVTLAEILGRVDCSDIHWLKIDVEGMEHDVLRSWGACEIRPWICVVESTKPNSPEQNYADWEPELLRRGYTFAYFDGLNRFYVHESQKGRLARFGPGPNVFDPFSIAEDSPFAGYLLELRDSAVRRIDGDYQELRERHRTLEIVQTATRDSNDHLLAELSKCQLKIKRMESTLLWRYLGSRFVESDDGSEEAQLSREGRARSLVGSNAGSKGFLGKIRIPWRRVSSAPKGPDMFSDSSSQRTAQSILSAIRKERS